MNKEIILSQVYELLQAKFGVPASASYNTEERIYYVNIYNLELKDFSTVSDFLADFSIENFDSTHTFFIPVMFTPEQTILAYPQYVKIPKVMPVSKGNWHNQNNESSSCDDMPEEELALAA